jgi:hypothetical protein
MGRKERRVEEIGGDGRCKVRAEEIAREGRGEQSRAEERKPQSKRLLGRPKRR